LHPDCFSSIPCPALSPAGRLGEGGEMSGRSPIGFLAYSQQQRPAMRATHGLELAPVNKDTAILLDQSGRIFNLAANLFLIVDFPCLDECFAQHLIGELVEKAVSYPC
jgi:hypothetical protein